MTACVCENRRESASGRVDSVRVAVFMGETKTENPAQTTESVFVFACACGRAYVREKTGCSPLMCIYVRTCTRNCD